MKFRTISKSAIFAAFCVLSWSAHAQTDVTIVTWGGNVATEMKKAWFEPATRGMNVRIRDDVLATYNDIRKHVAAGNVFWDVVDGATYQCEADGRDGYLEPLDFSVIKTDGLPKEQITKWSVPSTAFTMVLAYNKKKYKDNPPKSWKDFFDVKNFPGTQFLGPRITGTLEIALMADGVPPDKLYPLDVERGFKKLREFKPNVTGFAASYGMSTQLINDGEADMLYLPDNRYFAAARAGANYGYTYNQGLMNFDCLVVPKGSKNKELAMKIIANVVSPQINARDCRNLGSGALKPAICRERFRSGKAGAGTVNRASAIFRRL